MPGRSIFAKGAPALSVRTAIDGLERERIRLYFLGALPASERHAMQERMFRDAEFFTRMRLAEIDLIDALAAGWLPAGSIESARQFVVESSQPEAFSAAAGLGAALADADPAEPLLERLLRRFS